MTDWPVSRLPGSRHGDNRWNRALDLLCTAWEASGPDAVLAALGAVTSPAPAFDPAKIAAREAG